MVYTQNSRSHLHAESFGLKILPLQFCLSNSVGDGMNCLGKDAGQLGSSWIQGHRTKRRLFLYIIKNGKRQKVCLRYN